MAAISLDPVQATTIGLHDQATGNRIAWKRMGGRMGGSMRCEAMRRDG